MSKGNDKYEITILRIPTLYDTDQPMPYLRRLLRILPCLFLLDWIGSRTTGWCTQRTYWKNEWFPSVHARLKRFKATLHCPYGFHRQKGTLFHLRPQGFDLPRLYAIMGKQYPQWTLWKGKDCLGAYTFNPWELALTWRLPKGCIIFLYAWLPPGTISRQPKSAADTLSYFSQKSSFFWSNRPIKAYIRLRDNLPHMYYVQIV